VYYSRNVNAQLHDSEIEHLIAESELTETVDQTWSETLFYGIGNKHM